MKKGGKMAREQFIKFISKVTTGFPRVIPGKTELPLRKIQPYKPVRPLDYLHPQPYPVGKISREWRKQGIGVVNLKI